MFATIQRRETAKFSGSLGVDSLETSEVRENDESTSIEAFDPATRVSAMNCSNSTFASANNSRVRSSKRWVFGVSGELRCVPMLRFGVLNGESVLMLLPGVRPPLLLLIESLDRGDACDAITSATACPRSCGDYGLACERINSRPVHFHHDGFLKRKLFTHNQGYNSGKLSTSLTANIY
uniref:Uncharacterized protein n=1 Tax=Glossina pallidipes TaxID=7398 RepID=A0A1A9ZIH3_GLOPL